MYCQSELPLCVFTATKTFFSSFFKLKIYRWYISCTGIRSSVIRIASDVIILKFKEQVNHINTEQERPKSQIPQDSILKVTFSTIVIIYANTGRLSCI